MAARFFLQVGSLAKSSYKAVTISQQGAFQSVWNRDFVIIEERRMKWKENGIQYFFNLPHHEITYSRRLILKTQLAEFH